MPRPKLTVTVDREVRKSIQASAAKAGVRLSAGMPESTRNGWKIRAGLKGVAEWEKEHGAFTKEELKEARGRVRAQLRTPRIVRRQARDLNRTSDKPS